jgi:hypothetical protein
MPISDECRGHVEHHIWMIEAREAATHGLMKNF